MRRPAVGLLQVAVFRRAGLAQFGTTIEDYLATLAPLVALGLVVFGVLGLSGQGRLAVTLFCMLLISLLSPPVIAHPFCRRWGVASAWPHYANMLNWAQFLLYFVLVLMLMLGAIATIAGAPANAAAAGVSIAFFLYVLCLQWFIARGVLKQSRLRTALLLLATIGGSNLLAGVPLWVGSSMGSPVKVAVVPGL